MKRKIIITIYILLIGTFLLSIFKIKELPPLEKINNNLLNEPVQTETSREDFLFKYRNKNYEVKPLADYELYGLVVSKNNINTWYNYYHDKNSVNLKDLCVVWGNNIKNEVYRDENIKFKNGEWTCYYKWSSKLEKPFDPYKLSNNHLLSDKEKIREKINQVNVGDQIYIKGSLVDYKEEGTDWYRKTSLSRDDNNNNSRSGGACEVFFVDDIKILKTNNYFWNIIYKWNLKIIFFLLLLQFIFFIKKPFKNIK